MLPTCYTGKCTCNFLASLRRSVPDSVLETAIYTRNDGIVDWHYCLTGNPDTDLKFPERTSASRSILRPTPSLRSVWPRHDTNQANIEVVGLGFPLPTQIDGPIRIAANPRGLCEVWLIFPILGNRTQCQVNFAVRRPDE